MPYSFWQVAQDLLYAQSHRHSWTYQGLWIPSHGHWGEVKVARTSFWSPYRWSYIRKEFEFEWRFYALSASKAIFRARTYNCIIFLIYGSQSSSGDMELFLMDGFRFIALNLKRWNVGNSRKWAFTTSFTVLMRWFFTEIDWMITLI